MGAPGTWYWQGQAHSTSMKEPEDLLSTVEGPSMTTDDSYLGYSMAVGDFNGDRQDGACHFYIRLNFCPRKKPFTCLSIVDVAVGMPRGANLTGAVSIIR